MLSFISTISKNTVLIMVICPPNTSLCYVSFLPNFQSITRFGSPKTPRSHKAEVELSFSGSHGNFCSQSSPWPQESHTELFHMFAWGARASDSERTLGSGISPVKSDTLDLSSFSLCTLVSLLMSLFQICRPCVYSRRYKQLANWN